MNVPLTSEIERFMKVESGFYQRASEAARERLRLLKQSHQEQMQAEEKKDRAAENELKVPGRAGLS